MVDEMRNRPHIDVTLHIFLKWVLGVDRPVIGLNVITFEEMPEDHGFSCIGLIGLVRRELS